MYIKLTELQSLPIRDGETKAKSELIVGQILSGIDIRDTQSKEVSVHADFP